MPVPTDEKLRNVDVLTLLLPDSSSGNLYVEVDKAKYLGE